MDNIYKSRTSKRKSRSVCQNSTQSSSLNHPQSHCSSNHSPHSSHSCLSNQSSHSSAFVPTQYDEVEFNTDDTHTLTIKDNFSMNTLLISEMKNSMSKLTNSSSAFPQSQLTHMTENSYNDFNPTSDYKRKMIIDMANSVINESNNFNDINNINSPYQSKAFVPYEEQTEFQPSSFKSKRAQRLAKSITSRYTPNN